MQRVTSRQQAAPREPTHGAPPRFDRLLISLGCNPTIVADFLGDLATENAERAERDGRLSARLWYLREILRSIPHLAWSAARDGTPASRARLGAYLLAVIATVSVATIAWITRDGPPARLETSAATADGIVLNYVRPVQLSMSVLDAAGHRLKGGNVRYEWVSGMRIPVSVRGVVTCTRRGDAILRATLGALKTDFIIHCLPVAEIRRAGWGNFFAGDSARTLIMDAVGTDGQPVTTIAAILSVDDSTVATLDGSRLRPLKPGFTWVELKVGDQTIGAGVTVFERVNSLRELKPDQRWVAVPVRLAHGESVRWPLPTGLFFLAFSTDTAVVPAVRAWASRGSAHPGVAWSVDGPIMCMPDPQSGVSDTHCLARAPGASLTLKHPGGGAPDIVGVLALEREQQH